MLPDSDGASHFPEWNAPSSSPTSSPLGYIVGGGLKEGFRIRLTVPADTVQEGSFVVCESGRFRYYGLVTDLQLGSTDPRFADEQSDRLPAVMRRALYGQTLYTTLAVYPTLMLDLGPDLTAPEWGVRLADGRAAFRTAPWVAVAPGVALSVTVLAINLLAGGLAEHPADGKRKIGMPPSPGPFPQPSYGKGRTGALLACAKSSRTRLGNGSQRAQQSSASAGRM